MSTPLSINELPEEIMGAVSFEFVEHELEPYHQYQRPELLVRVCHLWKVWVEGNPKLWSRILVEIGRGDTPLDITPIKTRVNLAKGCPLALDVRIMGRRGSAALTHDVLLLYNLVKEHHWRALSILYTRWLSPFESIFRHLIDNPGKCRLTSFHIEGVKYESNDMIYALVREALRKNLGITDLSVPSLLLEPSHPLLHVVPSLEMVEEWYEDTIFGII
ncbi:hypothetical protein FRB94_006421 [Tulasnella sp. JGI-2019a]|nr:hypothetical protein FRB93_006195 [Tulasnella sp. JGI-2019a]KAG8999180.1 hypothetical protein FRB94_006421 [Tulasnella sp. JGI-2019a]